MHHITLSYGTFRRIPLPVTPLRANAPQDLVGNRIYLRTRIVYTVANDPENEEFDIPVAGVFDLVQEDGLLKAASAQIYLDASALFARIGEVTRGGNFRG
jgi:hypothetical protein